MRTVIRARLLRRAGLTHRLESIRCFAGTTVHRKLRSGIVGLPNVGKSTLFNALTESDSAAAANFPFCTIEPNHGVVSVPDPRLAVLSDISGSQTTLPAALEFVDIAGLVQGASKGEGLGNKFLANIRECELIVHVVRCFEDTNVVHVEGSVDPVRDAEVIQLELVLSDLGVVEKRLPRAKKQPKCPAELPALQKLLAALEEGQPARLVELEEDELAAVEGLGLLSAKPVIYAANVQDDELATGNHFVDALRKLADSENAGCVIVSAQVESELAEIDDQAERLEFLESLGVPADQLTGLQGLVRSTYALLGLQTYFTTGEMETRAWTITQGMKAPQAAGVIHSDFEKGFIRVEVTGYDDLVSLGAKGAKEAGKVRTEGKDYVVQEGDVLYFLTKT